MPISAAEMAWKPTRTSAVDTPILASMPNAQVAANLIQPRTHGKNPRRRLSAYVSSLFSTKLKVIAVSAATVWPTMNAASLG